mmetsp:Transcript_16109/g.40112  ORF Transcript_16109/g.40112 Transcript_16109/m.40112 type:complete len:387 (-) Transcript_16109:543-1703(-)
MGLSESEVDALTALKDQLQDLTITCKMEALPAALNSLAAMSALEALTVHPYSGYHHGSHVIDLGAGTATALASGLVRLQGLTMPHMCAELPAFQAVVAAPSLRTLSLHTVTVGAADASSILQPTGAGPSFRKPVLGSWEHDVRVAPRLPPQAEWVFLRRNITPNQEQRPDIALCVPPRISPAAALSEMRAAAAGTAAAMDKGGPTPTSLTLHVNNVDVAAFHMTGLLQAMAPLAGRVQRLSIRGLAAPWPGEWSDAEDSDVEDEWEDILARQDRDEDRPTHYPLVAGSQLLSGLGELWGQQLRSLTLDRCCVDRSLWKQLPTLLPACTSLTLERHVQGALGHARMAFFGAGMSRAFTLCLGWSGLGNVCKEMISLLSVELGRYLLP